MQNVLKTQQECTRISQRTFLSTIPTHGIHSYELNRRIPPSIPAKVIAIHYALTAICMLTGFTFCIPLKNKSAEEVVKAYLNHICCVFSPSKKILTDNGMEFKNKMWEEVYKCLRTEHRVTPIYSPQCNGRNTSS